ncbi:MAG TPA: ATP-binding protein [Burkholderiaceae bacterium]|nr:ATP-binding protein [Burkholderiaceae bacterium]
MIGAIVLPTTCFLAAAGIAYVEAFRHAGRVLEQTSRTVQEHASKVLEGGELLQRHVALLLGDAPPAAWRAREPSLHRSLAALAGDFPHVRGIWVIDAQGEAVAGSRLYPAPAGMNLAARDYFAVQRDSNAGPYVGAVIRTAVTQAEVFMFSRRIEAPDRRFAGVVAISMSPDYFTSFYRDLARAEPGLVATLVRADGSVLARWPAPEGDPTMAPDGPMARRIARGETSALFENTSAIDGVRRLVAYRKVEPYPLYATTGLSYEAILADWYRFVGVLALFTFPTAFALALACRVAMRRLASERDAMRAVREEVEARRRAESASRTKDEFLAMLGHELRNPMAAITSATRALNRPGLPDPGRRAMLEVLERQSARMKRLVDDLLDVGRVLSGKIRVDRVPIDLAATAERTASTMRMAGLLADRRVEVRGEPILVLGDATRLEQVIGNLLGNAVRHTAPQGSIEVTVERDGAWAVATVRDDGAGMTPELIARAFDLFEQGESELSRPGGGLGLGLTVCRRLVELHDGEIVARSDGPGRGSSFVVRLPALDA